MNRRSFLAGAAALPLAARTSVVATAAGVDIMRPPDRVTLRAGNRETALPSGVEVKAQPRGGELPILVSAPNTELEHIHLRWRGTFPGTLRFLGDHWERSYGDLEWRAAVPDRIMPWYFLASDGRKTQGFGVKTGAAALCFWQADPEGVSLWLDLRNGGSGVQLGERQLEAAVVRTVSGEAPFAVARELCRALCARPRLPEAPVYGGNNWYYTYGENFGPEDMLRDSDLLSELAPSGTSNRPFMVIDMGWGAAPEGAGPTRGNERFADMPGLASKMKQRGVRPGIWTRPLLTVENLPEAWRLPANSFRDPVKAPFFLIDPSVPEALEHVKASMRTIHGWGYELIKHDFSTFDLFGRWGFQMGVQFTNAGWRFADRSRTSAEIVLQFYRALREAAGSSLLLGCNTIGHLGAGLFEVQRIGDDTSGREWERTRKMGVNTLAFRLAQHNTFFAADADCVPLTPAIPWEMTRQWLDLVARSGTPLFVSAAPASVGQEQRAALKAAFEAASKPQPAPEPLDWMETTTPERWRLGGKPSAFQWCGDAGATPFAG